MSMIANGQTGLQRTLGSATFICLLLSVICFQASSQMQGPEVYLLAAGFAVAAWQCGLRFLLGTLTGSFYQVAPGTRILAAVLGFGGLLMLLVFPGTLAVCLAVALIAAVADIALLVMGR